MQFWYTKPDLQVFLTECARPFAEMMVLAASCADNSIFNKEIEYSFHIVSDLNLM